MFSAQPPARNPLPLAPAQVGEGATNWQFDDDLAIGCECANPALQIERWGLEESAPLLRQLS